LCELFYDTLEAVAIWGAGPELPGVSNQPARVAFVAALSNWRRNLAAVALVAVAFAVAGAVASDVVYYGAFLAAFSVWMGWFVLTAVDMFRRVGL